MNPLDAAVFQHADWASRPSERLAEGIERQMIWGERLMVCRLHFAPRVMTAVHSHPHEQITIVERGRVLFTMGGVQRTVSAGEIVHFPSGLPHGATILDEEAVLVDIFSPVREDFLATPDHGSR